MGRVVDEDIICALTLDKTGGIRLLFKRYYHPLVVYANRILSDNHKAEDIVQEFFIRLWEDEYLNKMNVANIRSYLYTAVRNSCMTHCTQKDILKHPVDISGVDFSVEIFSSIDDERIEWVLQEIKQLPPRTRQVVECVMLRELKYKEAAAELGISVNTVKFLLKEGTQRLRLNVTDRMLKVFFLFFRKKF